MPWDLEGFLEVEDLGDFGLIFHASPGRDVLGNFGRVLGSFTTQMGKVPKKVETFARNTTLY